MLLSRAEMTFDFGGARLDCGRDQALLGWMMNQFLYGEVTGIQCGHWLYDAPDLDAARFFARQAVEEFQHVDNFLRILELLHEKPAQAHGMVRFLTSGMMPATFEEHVCLEMAQGEGFVLLALYALIDTLKLDGERGADGAGIREILLRAVKQEERHVAFGERRTQAALAQAKLRGLLRLQLLGLSLVSMWGVLRLGAFMRDRLPREHEVLKQLPEFLAFTQVCAEQRLLRMGVLAKPLKDTGALERALALAVAYGGGLLLSAGRFVRRLWPFGGRTRVTDTYLSDPELATRMLSARAGRRPASEDDEDAAAVA